MCNRCVPAFRLMRPPPRHHRFSTAPPSGGMGALLRGATTTAALVLRAHHRGELTMTYRTAFDSALTASALERLHPAPLAPAPPNL